MVCSICKGQVLWDLPITAYGDNSTTCQNCGAKNSHYGEVEPDEEDE